MVAPGPARVLVVLRIRIAGHRHGRPGPTLAVDALADDADSRMVSRTRKTQSTTAHRRLPRRSGPPTWLDEAAVCSGAGQIRTGGAMSPKSKAQGPKSNVAWAVLVTLAELPNNRKG